MAKKQTRKSISINGELYERLRVYAERVGKSMSSITEQCIDDAILIRPDKTNGDTRKAS